MTIGSPLGSPSMTLTTLPLTVIVVLPSFVTTLTFFASCAPANTAARARTAMLPIIRFILNPPLRKACRSFIHAIGTNSCPPVDSDSHEAAGLHGSEGKAEVRRDGDGAGPLALAHWRHESAR